MDWEAAFKHFEDVRQQYRELAGMPGVNTEFALAFIFRPIATGYERGERSVELYLKMT